jgi:hypothetical protein
VDELSTLTANTFEAPGQSTPWAFMSTSVGMPGVVDELADPGDPDTVANAFAKVDSWIWTYIFAQPPAPVQLGPVGWSNNASGFTVAWTNPAQYNAAFLATPVPYITTLDIWLYSGVGTGGTLVGSWSITGSQYLPSGTEPVQALTFTINSGSAFATPTVASTNFTDNDSNNYGSLWTASQSETSMTTGEYTVVVGFKNYGQGTQNTLMFSGLSRQEAVPPNAPTGLTVTTLAGSPATNGAQVQVTNVVAPSQSENGSTYVPGVSPAINYYDYAATTVGAHTTTYGGGGAYPSTSAIVVTGAAQPTPRRWYSGYTWADTTVSTVTATQATGGTHVTITSTAPYDAPFAVEASANNTANYTFGLVDTIYTRSLLPAYTAVPIGSSLDSFTNATSYANAAVPITARTGSAVSHLYNHNDITGTTGLVTGTNAATSLNATTMPGLTSAYTASFSPAAASQFTATLLANGATQASTTLTVTGLDTMAALPTEQSTATGSVSLLVSAVGDAFTGAEQGFYGQATLGGRLYPALLAPSTCQYQLSFASWLAAQPAVTATTNTNTFYVDDLNTAPTNVALTISSVTGTQDFVCGVQVYTSSTTLGTAISAEYLGRWFLATPNLATAEVTWNSATLTQASLPVASTQLYDANLNPVNDTAAISTTAVRQMLFALPATGQPFTGGTHPVGVQATVYNPVGSTASATQTQYEGLPLYFDQPSLTLMAGQPAAGYARVTSGTDANGEDPYIGPSGTQNATWPAGTLGTDYGVAWNDGLTLVGTTELQLVDGYYAAFRSAVAPGYLNYTTAFFGAPGPDYSGAVSEANAGSWRYVMFQFNVTGNNAANTYLYLTINGGAGAGWGMNNSTYALNNVRMDVMFQGVTSSPASNGNGVWFDANALAAIGFGQAVNSDDLPNGLAVLATGGSTLPTTASLRVINVPQGTAFSNCTMYIRVGLNMGQDVAFQGFTYYFAST